MTFNLNDFRLDGKVAVVTGAGGRGNSIGRAYALGLAAAGASVVVADLNGDGATAVADAVDAGGRAVAVQVDITDRASVAGDDRGDARGLRRNRYPRQQRRANGRGGADPGDADYHRCLEPRHGGQSDRCTPLCAGGRSAHAGARGGRIVNQLSAGAFPASSVYGVSKLALLGLTHTLARELGPVGINVNAVAPGMTMSDAGKALTPPDSPFVKALEGQVALRLRGQPHKPVGALLPLCSPAGAWITGQTVNVDGGWVFRN